MKRVALIPLLAFALAVPAASAHTSSPAPGPEGSDCSWGEHGTSWEDSDGTVYTCHCARLNGPNGPEVLCRWYSDEALPARAHRKLKRHAKPRHVAKPKARYAISTGVLFHA